MKLNSVINTAADSLMGRGSGGAAPFRKVGAAGSRRAWPGQVGSQLCFGLPLTLGVQPPRVPIRNAGCAPGTPAPCPARLKTRYTPPCFPELPSREQGGLTRHVTSPPGVSEPPRSLAWSSLLMSHSLLHSRKFLVLFLSVFFNSSFACFIRLFLAVSGESEGLRRITSTRYTWLSFGTTWLLIKLIAMLSGHFYLFSDHYIF